MNTISDEVLSKFRDAAIEFFGPVAARNGLRLVATSLTEYAIPLRELTVRVRLIPSHIPDPVVSVFANDPRWIKESRLGSWGVNLLKFVQYQNPNFDFTDARLGSKADLRTKMGLLAELLAKYCEPLFRGDVFLWNSTSRSAEQELAQKSNAGI